VRAGLVTGGSSGIGLAIARMLREEGFELTIASRRRERVDAAADELGALGVAANVADEDDCRALVAAHRDRFGRLDLLVNSAGVGIASTIRELNTKHLDLQLGVNLRGLALVTREALPLLCETHGLVVNLASIAGTMPTPGLTIYGATKAAVIAFSKSLNYELEEDGVRVTAICPGFVDTPMAEWTGLPSDEMIRAEDCAELVRALLRLGPAARIPEIVVERVGERSGSPLPGA
jgi:NAD(P)-dependent dehydrogenase (short-subunit alcohol dehydrogenase family)